VEDVCADHKAAAQNRSICLSTQAIVPIMADRILIAVVIANLIDNALKYSPSESAVDISLEKSGAQAILEVADRGSGIRAAEKEDVFGKYFRSTRNKPVPGAGLGLYLVKRITEMHGGSISIEDRPGGGCIFRVSFPIGEPTKVQMLEEHLTG
jgi:signal transduction histidine kinase